MAVNELHFMKLKLGLELFVNSSYTKFHENPSKRSVADTRSQKAVVSIQGVMSLLHEEHLRPMSLWH